MPQNEDRRETGQTEGQTAPAAVDNAYNGGTLRQAVVNCDLERFCHLFASAAMTQRDKDYELMACLVRVENRQGSTDFNDRRCVANWLAMAGLLLDAGADITRYYTKSELSRFVKNGDAAFTLFEHGAKFSHDDLNTLLRRAVKESAGMEMAYKDGDDREGVVAWKGYLFKSKEYTKPDDNDAVRKIRSVRKLLKAGADQGILDRLFMEAAMTDDEALVKTALSCGADLHAGGDIALYSIVSGCKDGLAGVFAAALARRVRNGAESGESLRRFIGAAQTAAGSDKRKQKLATALMAQVRRLAEAAP